jgi:hypothetical protein
MMGSDFVWIHRGVYMIVGRMLYLYVSHMYVLNLSVHFIKKDTVRIGRRVTQIELITLP